MDMNATHCHLSGNFRVSGEWSVVTLYMMWTFPLAIFSYSNLYLLLNLFTDNHDEILYDVYTINAKRLLLMFSMVFTLLHCFRGFFS